MNQSETGTTALNEASSAVSDTGMISIEDLMDSSIDDIKDLPTYDTPSKGHYKLAFTLEKKDVNDHPSFSANFEIREVLELASASDPAPELGRKFNTLYMMDNVWGQGAFKKFMQEVAKGKGLQGQKISVLVEACKEPTLIAATVKHRKDKNDSEKVYADVVNVVVV